MKPLDLSRPQAAQMLVRYHFQQSSLAQVFERLGTVQYDPLKPLGRNPDLVLQARVPGYRVDDWQQAAYTERLIYDAWDKQACLVPISDWPRRALLRDHHRPYHDREILANEAAVAEAILADIDARGPLSSLELEGQQIRVGDGNSWYGTTRAKRILRALWVGGELVTHHRQAGRHYYDRPARVIPAPYFEEPFLLDHAEYQRWLLGRRHQAVGLLRSAAEASIWSGCGTAAERKRATDDLIEAGTLTPVLIDGHKIPAYAFSAALKELDQPPLEPRVIFMAPLDNFLWDRKEIAQLFGFDYIWEVYKPEKDRKWGYYVLPVLYGDRFIARVDARLEQKTWKIARWWWESDLVLDDALRAALLTAFTEFLHYLSADHIALNETIDPLLRHLLTSQLPVAS